jgi:hypothetical protein
MGHLDSIALLRSQLLLQMLIDLVVPQDKQNKNNHGDMMGILIGTINQNDN